MTADNLPLLAVPPLLEKINFLLDRLGIAVLQTVFKDGHWHLLLEKRGIQINTAFADAEMTVIVPDPVLLQKVHNIGMLLYDQYIRTRFTEDGVCESGS